MIPVGGRVKITLPGSCLNGRTVTIAAYRAIWDCPDLPPWPCFRDQGVLYALNPDWLTPAANAPAKPQGDQLTLL